MDRPMSRAVILVLAILLIGCSGLSLGTPGIGDTVSSQGWEVPVTGLHIQSELTSLNGTWEPNPGFSKPYSCRVVAAALPAILASKRRYKQF